MSSSCGPPLGFGGYVINDGFDFWDQFKENISEFATGNLVAWIIPKDVLSLCFSTPGIA